MAGASRRPFHPDLIKAELFPRHKHNVDSLPDGLEAAPSLSAETRIWDAKKPCAKCGATEWNWTTHYHEWRRWWYVWGVCTCCGYREAFNPKDGSGFDPTNSTLRASNKKTAITIAKRRAENGK